MQSLVHFFKAGNNSSHVSSKYDIFLLGSEIYADGIKLLACQFCYIHGHYFKFTTSLENVAKHFHPVHLMRFSQGSIPESLVKKISKLTSYSTFAETMYLQTL